MSFTERDWRRLLTGIGEAGVVPVVGPELWEVEWQGGRLQLTHVLARQLAERLGVDPSTLQEVRLRSVVDAFLSQPDSDPEDVYFELRELVEKGSWSTPRSLVLLAEILHFGLFVTTSFDSLLERALDEVRHAGGQKTRSLAYARRREPDDLPEDHAGEPLVYHLYGVPGAAHDFAVTEEDVLQFSHRLQARDTRPPLLFDRLREKSLLVLGCNFPGWLARFFLAASKGEQLFSSGARGVVADRQSRSDEALVSFLRRRKTAVYSAGDAADFVVELHRRWKERFGELDPADVAIATEERPAPTSAPESVASRSGPLPDSIFISFASEDRAQARLVREQLEKAGLDAWLDEEKLEGGDDYVVRIRRDIENSVFFLPLISKHTCITRKRFFHREWNTAIEVAKEWPSSHPFIQPIALDDTDPGAPNIPPEFAERHWTRLENGALPEKFVAKNRERIRARRREMRSA